MKQEKGTASSASTSASASASAVSAAAAAGVVQRQINGIICLIQSSHLRPGFYL